MVTSLNPTPNTTPRSPTRSAHPAAQEGPGIGPEGRVGSRTPRRHSRFCDERGAFGLLGCCRQAIARRAPARSICLVPGAMRLGHVGKTAQRLYRLRERVRDRVPMRRPPATMSQRSPKTVWRHLRNCEVPHGMDPPLHPTRRNCNGEICALRADPFPLVTRNVSRRGLARCGHWSVVAASGP